MFTLSSPVIAGICLAGLLEGAGVPWPGALIIAGAAAGMGGSRAAIPVTGGIYAIGYCMGALLQYGAGRLLGPLAFSLLSTAQRDKLGGRLARSGPAAVLWLRPLAIGNYISIPAGMMRMPLPRFTLYTLLGITPWALVVSLTGWAFGQQFSAVTATVSQWLVPVGVITGLALLLAAAVKRLLRRRNLHSTAASREENLAAA